MKIRLVRAPLLVVVAAAVTLSGCASMEDFAKNPEKQKTRQGAAIGAAGGTVVGLLISPSWKGALIGAGVGALAGGAVGSYMDNRRPRSASRWPAQAWRSSAGATTSLSICRAE